MKYSLRKLKNKNLFKTQILFLRCIEHYFCSYNHWAVLGITKLSKWYAQKTVCQKTSACSTGIEREPPRENYPGSKM